MGLDHPIHAMPAAQNAWEETRAAVAAPYADEAALPHEFVLNADLHEPRLGGRAHIPHQCDGQLVKELEFSIGINDD
jgi:hypothetical protein